MNRGNRRLRIALVLALSAMNVVALPAVAMPNPFAPARERLCGSEGSADWMRIGPAGALERMERDPQTGCWRWIAVNWGGPR